MNLIASFQRWLGGKLWASTPSSSVARVLTDLQHLCSRFPQGKRRVQVLPGQLTLCFTWQPSASEQGQPGMAYFVNGTNDDVEYAEILSEEVSPLLKVKSCESKTKKIKPSKQQAILQKLFMFLDLHYAFRYNRLTDQTECALLAEPCMSLTEHELKYQPVDNRLLNSISLAAMKAGVECWDRDVKRYLDSSEIAVYHPFTDYLKQLPQWDGTDRVSLLAQRVSLDATWVRCFHRWMLGCVAQWMYPKVAGQHANSVAPILISARQGMGKSTFCRKLLPDGLQDYYTDSFDLTQPGSAEHKLTTFGLINLDEFDRLPASRMAQLKNLMQMERLHVRRAYKQHGEPLPRIANFIATSNRRDLLTDMTGSRRFICVEVEHFIDCQTPIEYEQLYAQLKEELQQGERSWFSKEEEAVIQERNRTYYRVTPAQELLEGVFTLAQPGEEGACLLSAVQIYTQLKQKNLAALRDCSPTAFSRLLAQMGTRVHTRYGNGYWVKLR